MSAQDICSSCGELSPSDSGIETPFTDITKTAARGCESCALIQHAVHDCVPAALAADSGNVVIIVRQAIMRYFVEVVVKWDENAVILDLFVEANRFSPFPHIRTGKPISGNSISRASFELVNEWVQDCLENHSGCISNLKPLLPSRVIDLQTAFPDVRLLEPHDKYEKYICLSHCWGDSRTIITTTEQLVEFKDRIRFSHLPRTFQEAAIFARKLGVGYLWIDSLCIIQDSEEDWQRESSVMSKIYENSYLTLAATGATSDNEGLFFKHPISKVSSISRTGHEYEVHIRPVIDHMDDAHFPLFTRAWVFQERLLAPRVLHFGRQELWWECLERVACECGGIFGERYGTGQEKFLSKLTHQEALTRHELNHVRRRWHAIIEEYSQLALTKMRDKLPALSGIARQIASLREGEYLAGVWGDTLILDLLWYRPDPLSGRLTSKWRSPSWSWAALDGPVRYFDAPSIQESPNLSTTQDDIPGLKFTYISISEAAAINTSENVFGEVKSAHLCIKGPMAPIQVFNTRTGSTSSRTLQRRRHNHRLRTGYYEFRFEHNDSTNSYAFFADYDLYKHDATFRDSDYAILRVGTDENGDEYALLLKCIHAEQGICERIGMFTTKFSRWPTSDHMEVFGAAFIGEDTVKEFTLV